MINNKLDCFKKQLPTLKPKKNDLDFFLADDLVLTSFRNEIIFMEHPLFALKSKDIKDKFYTKGNVTISIEPTSVGIATIFDKDVWIYAISKMHEAIKKGQEIDRIIYFTAYDFFKVTNRGNGGKSYKDLEDSLKRLKGTTITTNIKYEHKNKQQEMITGVGLIDSYTFVQEKKGTMKVGLIEVVIPKWLFNSIENSNVLKISPDYFRIRKAIDRRIYELARKHCGNQYSFSIYLNNLFVKSGSSSNKTKFKFNLKELSEKNDLPDYEIFLDVKTELVTFKNRNYTPKLSITPTIEELKQSETYHLYESILFTFECLENQTIKLLKKEFDLLTGYKNKFETEKEITFKTKKQEEYFLGVLTRKGTLKNKTVLNEAVKNEKKKIKKTKKVKTDISIDPDNHFLEGATTGNKYLFENGYVQIFGAKYPYFNRDGLVCGCNDYEILNDLIHAGKLNLCEK